MKQSANIMPIGKYKNQKLQVIPTDYLEWILTTNINNNNKWAIRCELSNRQWRKPNEQLSQQIHN